MKKTLLILSTVMILFSSCNKEDCKERQEAKLKSLFIYFQSELNNQNLTQKQIEEINKQYLIKQNKILAECK